MRRTKYLIIAIGFVVIAVVAVVGYFLFNYLNSKAALFVESDPVSIVYINGKQVGKTPYQGELDEKEITLKLVPESFDVPLLPYETQLSLTKGVRTVVRRTLGESRQTSSGEIISFEHIGGKGANVSVITTPDGSEVVFDNREKEFSPARFTNVASGTHELEVKALSYLPRKFEVIAESGFNLTAIVELPRDLNYQPEELPSEEDLEDDNTEKDQVAEVTIMETPTGFLRIRGGPDVTNEEVGRATPGATYEVISIDSESGWYEIAFDEDKTGWVTDAYATPSAEIGN